TTTSSTSSTLLSSCCWTRPDRVSAADVLSDYEKQRADLGRRLQGDVSKMKLENSDEEKAKLQSANKQGPSRAVLHDFLNHLPARFPEKDKKAMAIVLDFMALRSRGGRYNLGREFFDQLQLDTRRALGVVDGEATGSAVENLEGPCLSGVSRADSFQQQKNEEARTGRGLSSRRSSAVDTGREPSRVEACLAEKMRDIDQQRVAFIKQRDDSDRIAHRVYCLLMLYLVPFRRWQLRSPKQKRDNKEQNTTKTLANELRTLLCVPYQIFPRELFRLKLCAAHKVARRSSALSQQYDGRK
ncbi:unnamed protein product, partial [Amoebophrya sp. A25]